MAFELPPLPYAEDALEPHISARTMQFHYGKHHQAYVNKLNDLVDGTRFADMDLERIIREAAGDSDSGTIFNNAAQTWNHTFFWNSMSPDGGGNPDGALADEIDRAFGSLGDFTEKFKAAAVGQFGSGWAWLVHDGDGLAIETSANAGTPVADGRTCLLTCDVWEHAYYLDYQNRRPDFVQAFLDNLVNWDFAARQLENDRKAA